MRLYVAVEEAECCVLVHHHEVLEVECELLSHQEQLIQNHSLDLSMYKTRLIVNKLECECVQLVVEYDVVTLIRVLVHSKVNASLPLPKGPNGYHYPLPNIHKPIVPAVFSRGTSSLLRASNLLRVTCRESVTRTVGLLRARIRYTDGGLGGPFRRQILRRPEPYRSATAMQQKEVIAGAY